MPFSSPSITMDVHNFLYLVIVALVINPCHCDKSHDAADVYFKSNTMEMQDRPLTFDKPPPTWLKGTLIRNGLGRFEVGARSFVNSLDAYGKLASWKFPGNGTAYFTTKMIYTESYMEALKTNDIAPYLLLDKVTPSFSIAEEIEVFKNGPDNTNVNIRNFGGDKLDFVVLSDYWKVYTVDPYTLETQKKINPLIPNAPRSEYPIEISSAHPLPEYGTSNFLTFVSVVSFVPGVKGKTMLTRARSSDEREIIATIEVDKASYMHSFAVTEHYAILFAVPFYVDPVGMLKHFIPLDAFQWDSNAVTKLYVINVKTGEITTLQTENMFFLHVANAYESDVFENEIIVDVCTFRNTSGLLDLEIAKLHSPSTRADYAAAYLKRYTLNLKSGTVNIHEYDVTSDVTYVNQLDFPTINENYRSKKNCYIYGIVYNYDRKDFFHSAIVKKDVCAGKNEYSWTSSAKLMNEAYFVPRPGATDEDDGVLLAPVLDSFSKNSSLVILDAKDLTLLSSTVLPTYLPFGTHGHFFDYIV